ncbi:MAG: CCA tRNA nucleotidyltransferase [bacterium]|nr:CCA tRNA nucleotidyltransferase [bacterium]
MKTLHREGFRALLAGGCVRDMQMGLPASDYDIATNADLETVIRLFPNAREVGAHFGVVVVKLGEENYEVARFRKDLGSSDGRHPDRVVFVDEREDANRRDFTVNGLFYDPVQDRVLDYVGGQADLSKGVIRTIGRPEDRFSEDRLRMLRAVRFGCRFLWSIDKETYGAIGRLGGKIGSVSQERVRDECIKILTEGGAPQGIRWLINLGLMRQVMPEVTAMIGVPQPMLFHPEGDVLTHTLMMLGLMEKPSPELAMGILLHDVGKAPTFRVADRIRFHQHPQVGSQIAESLCARLRFSNAQIEHIVRLVKDHHLFMHAKQMRQSRLKRFLRTDRFEDHLELHRVDCLSCHSSLGNYTFCKHMWETLAPEAIRPEPFVTGHDLIRMGYVPGPVFKTVLTAIEDAQLEGRVSDREAALELAKVTFRNLGISKGD